MASGGVDAAIRASQFKDPKAAIQNAYDMGKLEGMKRKMLDDIAQFSYVLSDGVHELLASDIKAATTAEEARLLFGAVFMPLMIKEQERLKVSIAEQDVAIAGAQRRADHAKRILSELDYLEEWRSPDLGSVTDSLFHQVTERTLLSLDKGHDGQPSMAVPPLLPAMHGEGCEVFLVQHDWAALLESAAVDDGEIRLPFDRMCFEFEMGGRRVCLLVRSEDGAATEWLALIKGKTGWLTSEGFSNVADKLRPQVRAIAITLDAEVTTAEIIRAPTTGNAARIKHGHLPRYDYHVLKIVRRPRYLPAGNEPTGHRKRLHFRRGHWRHYHSHKTWIRWCLVGDPSLGFADKDYRL